MAEINKNRQIFSVRLNHRPIVQAFILRNIPIVNMIGHIESAMTYAGPIMPGIASWRGKRVSPRFLTWQLF
jgi:hypothetical protein